MEDWSSSIRTLCLRCSYGVPHRGGHPDAADAAAGDDWQSERQIGIGAQGRDAVTRLLADWAAAAPGRSVDAIECREVTADGPVDGSVWWLDPDDQSVKRPEER